MTQPAAAAATPETDESLEHEVTPLELFFDLVLVFAITQVTVLIAHEPTWRGLGRAGLVLIAIWGAWTGYAWLTSSIDVDEGGVRLAMLVSMGAMLFMALAVPHTFGRDGVLFGAAYVVVRVIHVLLSTVITKAEQDRRSALLRFAPGALLGASLILVAGFLDGSAQIAVWIVALTVDYLGPLIIGIGEGWRVAPEHFAERHGLIILIALGESIVAIGVAANVELTRGVIAAVALAFALVSALWWLYFDVAAVMVRRRFRRLSGLELAKLARDAYTYLHLPMVAGIVLFAFGLKVTLHDVNAELPTVPAVALCGGAALYLLGHIAFIFRATHYLFRRRTIGAVVLLAVIPAATRVPSIAALGMVAGICVLVVAYEAIRHRQPRAQLRHGLIEP
jgi:low temperature requirement protein LtrA